MVVGVRRNPALATKNRLENTDGVLRPDPHQADHHQCSLGAAACYLLVILTRAILMPSLFQRPKLGHYWRTGPDLGTKWGGGRALKNEGTHAHTMRLHGVNVLVCCGY